MLCETIAWPNPLSVFFIRTSDSDFKVLIASRTRKGTFCHLLFRRVLQILLLLLGCMYNWADTVIYLLMYMQVYLSFINTYTAAIRRKTYHIMYCSIWYGPRRICTYMYVFAFLWKVYFRDCGSICVYFQFILAYTAMWWGDPCQYMSVYACTYD